MTYRVYSVWVDGATQLITVTQAQLANTLAVLFDCKSLVICVITPMVKDF